MNIRSIIVNLILAALPCAATGLARADDVAAASSAALRAKYVSLQDQLGRNQFQRPIHLESRETPGEVTGDVYAIVNSPFDSAGAALGAPGDWCDILMLHSNTKACSVAGGTSGTTLNLWVGAKTEQQLTGAFKTGFVFYVRTRTASFLRVEMSAERGPMSTRDYRIVLEAVPLEDGRTFIHLAYSYGYGIFGRLAMETYLATGGRNKVGFTVVGAKPDGQVRNIDGIRGVVERNTMRYYLAIEAFLGGLSVSPQARFEKRVRDWYASVERYPVQLHEMDLGEYLEMKRNEKLRQQESPG